MQDLRTAPPVSKTTIIVVLVVFGLVLVVSVFGLWAFSSYVERRRGDLREAAVKDARGELDRIEDAADDRFKGLLWRVAEVDGPEELRKIRASSRHGGLVREIFRFDELGDIRWVDRAYRLYAQPDRVNEEARRQTKDTDQGSLELRLLRVADARREGGAPQALVLQQELVDELGLLATETDGDDRLYAAGVGYAVTLLQTAWEVADTSPEKIDGTAMRRAVMRALEVETLWQDRKNIRNFSARLAALRREIERTIEKMPAALRAELEWEVKRYRRYRTFVRDPNRHAILEVAVGKVKRGRRVVLYEDPELLGVVREGVGDTLVARLDPDAAFKVIQDFVNPGTFRALGMVAAVFPLAAEARWEDMEPSGRELSLIEPPIELPFRLAYFQTGDPKEITGGITDLLFWVVIGLAGAGLLVGGYVLIRLLTREIRVAQLKSDFVSNLSHELKTPITSISLFTEMLDDGKITKPDEQAEAFSVLADESQRLQRIVARMINVARGEARRNPFELEPGDLNAVAMEVATRFRRITTEPGLDLVMALFPEPLPIRMDLQAMDDAVTNLLSNAWKYKRGDHVRITVRTARRGRHAELVVSDDGVGIPREDRRRVFEMFYRANQYLTHPVAGTGLGLALVRNVVRGHDGTVRVEAGEGGKGAAFRLRFPMDLMGLAAEERAASAPAATEPTTPVILDDDGARPPAPKVEQTRATSDEGPARPKAGNRGAQPS